LESVDKVPHINCPECQRILNVTFPDGFYFNRAKAKCTCGFEMEVEDYSDISASEYLKEMIDKYEPKDIIKGMW
jgi:hypothetical protein